MYKMIKRTPKATVNKSTSGEDLGKVKYGCLEESED